VVVADEPTGDLDSETSDHILDLLVRLNSDLNTTLLIVTHDPRVAASRVRRDDRGRFAPADPVGEFTRWDLNADDAPKAA